jgi:hypothetical protein
MKWRATGRRKVQQQQQQQQERQSLASFNATSTASGHTCNTYSSLQQTLTAPEQSRICGFWVHQPRTQLQPDPELVDCEPLR